MMCSQTEGKSTHSMKMCLQQSDDVSDLSGQLRKHPANVKVIIPGAVVLLTHVCDLTFITLPQLHTNSLYSAEL